MQSLDKLQCNILKTVMLKALMCLSVRDPLIRKHFTTLASLSTACHLAVAGSDIRHRIKRGDEKVTLIVTMCFFIDDDES